MQNCSALTVQGNPGVEYAYVGTPNVGNSSSILKSCCHGAPVAEYSDDSCMIYCNVTAPASVDEVNACLDESGIGYMSETNATRITPSPTPSPTSATHSPTATDKPVQGGAMRRDGLSKTVWMVFGLGILGVFGGLL